MQNVKTDLLNIEQLEHDIYTLFCIQFDRRPTNVVKMSCFVKLLLLGIFFMQKVEGITDFNDGVLNVLNKFDFFKQEKCLVIMFGNWTMKEINVVQNSIDNVGIIFLDESSEDFQTPANLFCQVAIMKDSQKLEEADYLCKFKLRAKCISILSTFSEMPQENQTKTISTEGKSDNLTVAVIEITQSFKTSPTTYSIWYPQCGNYFKNVFILKESIIRTNKGNILINQKKLFLVF